MFVIQSYCLIHNVIISLTPRVDSLKLGASLEACHVAPLRVHYTED